MTKLLLHLSYQSFNMDFILHDNIDMIYIRFNINKILYPITGFVKHFTRFEKDTDIAESITGVTEIEANLNMLIYLFDQSHQGFSYYLAVLV